MPRPKPWLKMWIEWVDDPKMLRLTLAERGAWWSLVTLAQKCNAGGKLVTGSGSPLSLEEIATCLHFTSKGDITTLHSMVAKMQAEGSLSWNDNILTIIHFVERQETAPSETPEARRERVRRYRERHAVTEKSLQSPQSPQTPLTTTKEGEVEQRESVTARKSLHVTEKALHLEAVTAEIANLYEKNIGKISAIFAEKLSDFVQNYTGPVWWIKEAFKEALAHRHPNWAYIEAILNRWQEEGGPDGRAKEEPERPERSRPAQPRVLPERRRPITYIPGADDSHPGAED